MGGHLVCSYLCPAQVGGGADLSFCFLLWGMFSWSGFDVAGPPPNNPSPGRGGCASLQPSIQGFVKSCLKGGRGFDAWRVSFHRRMIMWNGIKREDFGRVVIFTVVHGWVAQFSAGLGFCHLFYFFDLLFKLLVFVISFSIHSFLSVIVPLLPLPFFFCERQRCWGCQDGCPRQGPVHGHHSSFTQFCWRLTLNCQQLLFLSSANTVSDYFQHHLHYYYYYHHQERYRHHLQSSALFRPFHLSILFKTLCKNKSRVIFTVSQTHSEYNCTQK